MVFLGIGPREEMFFGFFCKLGFTLGIGIYIFFNGKNFGPKV
jgi:hypothetical protein